MAEIGGLSLQVYVGGVAKANIGPMNVGQWKIDNQKMPLVPLAGPHDEHGPVIPRCCGECVSPGKFFKIQCLLQKNHTGLDDGINVENESKTQVGHKKCIFWQTAINDQRPKLRVYINLQFLRIGALSQVKQSMKLVECLGPE